MNDILNWCNTNQGFLSGLLTILALLLSMIAIIITLRNENRQKRIEKANIDISLLDRRIEIYNYFLNVIHDVNDEML